MKVYVTRASEKSVKKIVEKAVHSDSYENIGIVELKTVEDILALAKKTGYDLVISPNNEYVIDGEEVTLITVYDYYMD